MFTHLVGEKANELNDLLTQGGFRRSQNIAYRPACEHCRACVSVRILANEFEPTRSMRRVLARNEDLAANTHRAEPSTEQYSLFRHYLDARHRKGGMSDMTVLDYAMMVEDTHVKTQVIEYRAREAGAGPGGRGRGELVAVALTDVMGDGLSMVYSFYDPDMTDRSLGTYMILDHIERARLMGLPHVYLGYWVHGLAQDAVQDPLHSPGASRAEGLGAPGLALPDDPRLPHRPRLSGASSLVRSPSRSHQGADDDRTRRHAAFDGRPADQACRRRTLVDPHGARRADVLRVDPRLGGLGARLGQVPPARARPDRPCGRRSLRGGVGHLHPRRLQHDNGQSRLHPGLQHGLLGDSCRGSISRNDQGPAR